MNSCIICKRDFDYQRSKGGTKSTCNSCTVNKRRLGLKTKCINHLGGKCLICGYNKCQSALEFHHKNPEEKVFSISGAHSRSWKSIEEELNKCILICANCHREIHERQK